MRDGIKATTKTAQAITRGGRWVKIRGDDLTVDMLNLSTEYYLATLLSGSDPNPEKTMVRFIKEQMEGVTIRAPKQETSDDDFIVY